MKRICLLALVVVCLLTSIPSQANDIHFSKLGMAEGLSQPSVMCIYQDELGTFWFGTREGLACYSPNGTRFLSPEPGNPNSLYGERIRQICGNRKGKVFILTNRGISEYDLRTDSIRTLESNVFTALSYSKEKLWTAEYNRIYLHENNHTKEYFQFPGHINISAIRETEDGGLVIGTASSGVWYIGDNKQPEQLLANTGRISVVYEDSGKDIWVGSWSKGLYRLRSKQPIAHYHAEATKAEFRLLSDFVRDICEDNQGTFWVGTSLGLNNLDTKKGRTESYKEGKNSSNHLSDRSIWSLYKDGQGNIWIGTYYGGVNYFNPKIRSYTYIDLQYPGKNKNATIIIGTILEDERGNLFLCTEGDGIVYYDIHTKTCRRYAIRSTPGQEAETSSNIRTAYYDKDRRWLWLGLHLGGLCCFDAATGRYATYENKLANFKDTGESPSISSIKPYGKDSLLVGTSRGLYVFDLRSKHFSLFSEYLHKQNPYVSDFLFDYKQNLWVAGKGLLKFNPSTREIKEYLYDPDDPSSLSSNNMEKLFLDSKGCLWIATGGGGVNLYDAEKDRFIHFDQNSCGLKNNYIGDIEESPEGYLYILHTEGISRLGLQDYRLYNYETENGFPLSSVYGGDICMGRDGNIYLSGTDGLVALSENSLNRQHIPFKVEFQDLSVNNHRIVPGDSTGILKQALAFTDKVRLKHNQTIFSVSFITDNYISSNRCVYEYQMSGLSDQWIKLPPQVYTLNFMHLTQGDYTLKVRGRWEDSLQATCERELRIHVSPPFYRTWWAYLCYAIALFALIQVYLSSAKSKLLLRTSLAYEKKEKERIEQTNQSKLRFFTNISHEFRTPLTLILGQVEMLLNISKAHPAIYNKLLAVKRNASLMQNLITELLEFRKYEQGHLELKVSQVDIVGFLDKIHASFAEMARARKITFRLYKPQEPLLVWIDPQQMQKVFYNLISNAFKFTSEQGNISIGIEDKGQQVCISVADNGIGIPEEHIRHIFERFYQVDNEMQVSSMTPGTGIGLALCKLVVDAHAGSISVSSTPGGGSLFTVFLQKGNSHFAPSVIQANEDVNLLCIEQATKVKPEMLIDIASRGKTDDETNKPLLLIVEDNAELQAMLHEAFAHIYRTSLASDGEEGLRKTAELHPDLVLSDIMMPQLSGSDMCRQIKENPELCHIPVILLTARTTLESNIEGLKNGADDYITKPFNIETLVLRCNNIINNRRILQQKFSRQPDASAKMLATNQQDMLFIEKVCAVIEQHIDDPSFDISVLCTELNMGRTKFFAKLKGISGQTPNDFILNIKLKKASAYLRDNPEMSVADITYTLGFSTPKYFGICFKEQFGMSPTAYRKQASSAQ